MNYKRTGSTIYDIAREAGVSPTTVSRVLSDGSYPVSEETRKRVFATADALNYTPKGKLRPSERDVVVMIPSLSNLYYAALLSGLETSLRMFGLNTLLMNTKGDISLEKRLVNELCRRDSVRIIIAPVCDDLRHLQPLFSSNVPLVVMEQPSAGERSTISVNFFHGGEMITDYLVQRDMRRIAFLGTPLSRFSRTQVYEGYCSALKKANIEPDPQLTFIAEEEPPAKDDISPFYTGMYLLDRMVRSCAKLPDAIVCGNDITAIGALRRLQELGIRVPEDISLAGYDNIFPSAVSFPPLTTVDQCTYEMGGMAAEILYGNLMDPTRQHVNTILEPKLIVRETVR